MRCHGRGGGTYLLVSLISQCPSGDLVDSITRPSSRAIRGIVVVTAGKLSQVMNNSPDCLKAFASFSTTVRQYGLVVPEISSRFLLKKKSLLC
jgi:hypothetical protein